MDLTKLSLSTLSLSVILEYFHLREESLIIFAILLVVDYILGITHAYMRDKQDVRSTRMRSGLWKKVLRFTIPFTAVIVLKGVGFDQIGLLISSVMSILIASEGYSILRHYMYIHAKKELSEIDSIEYVLQKLLDIVRPTLPDKKNNVSVWPKASNNKKKQRD